MREEFEKLSCVAKKLERAHFVEKDGVYYPNNWNLEVDRECAEWLDGALYAYQEQQKNKEKVLSKINQFESQSVDDKRLFLNDLLTEIKELLK